MVLVAVRRKYCFVAVEKHRCKLEGQGGLTRGFLYSCSEVLLGYKSLMETNLLGTLLHRVRTSHTSKLRTGHIGEWMKCEAVDPSSDDEYTACRQCLKEVVCHSLIRNNLW